MFSISCALPAAAVLVLVKDRALLPARLFQVQVCARVPLSKLLVAVAAVNPDSAVTPALLLPVMRHRLAVPSYCIVTVVPAGTARSAPVPVMTRFAAVEDALWFDSVSTEPEAFIKVNIWPERFDPATMPVKVAIPPPV